VEKTLCRKINETEVLMKTRIKVTVLVLSLAILFTAIPATSGAAGKRAATVSTLQSPTLAVTAIDFCSALPKLEADLAFLEKQPQTPLVKFFEALLNAGINYLKSIGCKS
jgi:hypothetical protein